MSGTDQETELQAPAPSGGARFTQVDPIGMSAASISDPQSFNLYSYVQNDPLNFVDPSGLNASCSAEFSYAQCGGDEGFWGGGGGGGGYFGPGGDGGGYAGMPASAAAALSRYLLGLEYTLARLYGTIGRALEGFGSSRFGLDLLALQHPQNPAPAPATGDCARFADRVAQIASGHSDVRGFVNELARTFIGVISADVDVMRENANNSVGERFILTDITIQYGWINFHLRGRRDHLVREIDVADASCQRLTLNLIHRVQSRPF